MQITLLREPEIRECVRLDDEAIAAVEAAFGMLADGKALVPPIIGIEVPEHRGELDIKTARIRGLDSFAIKIASGFFDNEKRGLPVASGMMVVISAQTGFPEAVLLDNGYLTQVRTGAAGAIAAKYLARNPISTVGVIGAGTQGRFQAMGLPYVRKFARLLIYDIAADKAQGYAEEMTEALNTPIEVAGDVASLVAESDVVVTTTPSRSPYLHPDNLRTGLHITAVGADMEEKQELFSGVFQLADVICCDLRSQCAVRGELHHAIAGGHVNGETDVVEIGDLVLGRRRGRSDDAEITICDLTGVGVQDTAIARLALSRGRESGLGLVVDV